jgi:hypothetical protein
MASIRVQPQGEYAKNMYRCPDEWRRLISARRAREARAEDGRAVHGQRAESEFLPEQMRRRLHIVEPRIDVKA